MLSTVLKKISVAYPLSSERESKVKAIIRNVCLAWLLFFPLLTLFRLTYDVPTSMGIDGAIYTDEGFYSSDAIQWYKTGVWFKEGRYNQFINLPLLQFVQAAGFYLFGFGLLTVRLINWGFNLLWLGMCYLLFRRLIGPNWALLGISLVVSNHVVYGMTRFALAEIPMSFFVTAAFVCSVYATGRYRYPLAALCAVSYSLALLTKTNALCFAPVLALTTMLVEPRPKPIIIKFLLCSSVFFAFMATYYLLLIKPYREQFEYFYTLNIAIAGSTDLAQWAHRFNHVYHEMFVFADPFLVPHLFYVALVAALFTRRHNLQPLLWLSIAWLVMYFIMYTYYGRIYPRFFTVAMPAVVGIWLSLLKNLWDLRKRFFYLSVPIIAVLVIATGFNLSRIAWHAINAQNSYNEFATKLEAIMDADPSDNRKIMGHPACSVAIRMRDAMPIHERYGIVSFEQRVREDIPRYWVAENLPRRDQFAAYYAHREWIELYFDVEFLGRWDVLENYRHYQMAAFRLHPKWDKIEEGFQRFGGTRPAEMPQ